jgi:hypothetical protein
MNSKVNCISKGTKKHTHTPKQTQIAFVRLVKRAFDCNFQYFFYMLVSTLSVN